MTFVEFMSFDKDGERVLRATIERLHGEEAMLSYYQLHGLLLALACSPEAIKPAEWFEMIWLNDEPQFDSEEEAKSFFKSVVSLFHQIQEMSQQHRFLPFSANYSERWQPELAQWCEGLLMGHQYLEDLWLIAIEDLDDASLTEEVEVTLSLAATFADFEDAKQMSLEQDLSLGDEHLPEAYQLFWKVLAGYACVASLWGESHWEADTEQMFLSLESVPRDQQCPCGSGEVFAKCCLH